MKLVVKTRMSTRNRLGQKQITLVLALPVQEDGTAQSDGPPEPVQVGTLVLNGDHELSSKDAGDGIEIV